MANPAFVQKTEIYTASPGGTSLATSAITNTAGNTLVVVIGFESNVQSNFTISDTLGNTWVDLGNKLPSSGAHASRVFYCINCKAGSNVVTISWGSGSGANLFLDIAYLEYSGITKKDSSIAVAVTGPNFTSSSISTSNPICMLVGVGDDGEGNWTPGLIGGTTGNLRTATSSVAPRNSQRHAVQDFLVISTGTYTSTCTNATTGAGTAWILAFAQAPGVPNSLMMVGCGT